MINFRVTQVFLPFFIMASHDLKVNEKIGFYPFAMSPQRFLIGIGFARTSRNSN